MRIGITCYPTYGGSGAVATELGLELGRRGHEVHIISYASPFRLRGGFAQRVTFHEVVPTDYPLFEHSPYALALAVKQHEVALREDLQLMRAPPESGRSRELRGGDAVRRREPRLRGRAAGALRGPGARGRRARPRPGRAGGGPLEAARRCPLPRQSRSGRRAAAEGGSVPAAVGERIVRPVGARGDGVRSARRGDPPGRPAGSGGGGRDGIPGPRRRGG